MDSSWETLNIFLIPYFKLHYGTKRYINKQEDILVSIAIFAILQSSFLVLSFKSHHAVYFLYMFVAGSLAFSKIGSSGYIGLYLTSEAKINVNE